MATKKCPYCAEEIQEEAILCRYCGSRLTEEPEAPKPPEPEMKKCPFCAEMIKKEAVLCKFCGNSTDGSAGIAPVRPPSPEPRRYPAQSAPAAYSAPAKGTVSMKLIFTILSVILLATIVSVFFPFFKANIVITTVQSPSLFDYDWKWIIGHILVLGIPFSFFEKRRFGIAALIATADVIYPLGLWNMATDTDYPKEMYQPDLGFYVLLIGIICFAVISIFCFVMKTSGKLLEDDEESPPPAQDASTAASTAGEKTWVCSCGSINSKTQDYCKDCGKFR